MHMHMYITTYIYTHVCTYHCFWLYDRPSRYFLDKYPSHQDPAVEQYHTYVYALQQRHTLQHNTTTTVGEGFKLNNIHDTLHLMIYITTE